MVVESIGGRVFAAAVLAGIAALLTWLVWPTSEKRSEVGKIAYFRRVLVGVAALGFAIDAVVMLAFGDTLIIGLFTYASRS